MPDHWTLVTPDGNYELNASFSAPKYQAGGVDTSAALRRDDRTAYQRSGDGLRTPGPLVLYGRVWRDDMDVPEIVGELNDILDAVAATTDVVRTTPAGTYTYSGLSGGPTPEVTPDGLGGWQVVIELWPARAAATFLPPPPPAICSNFNDLPLGEGIPAGWTDRWAAGAYEVDSGGYGVPEGYGPAVLLQSGTGNRLLTRDALDGAGPDIELLALGRFTGAFAGGPWVRASGAAGSENGYGIRVRTDTAAPRLVKATNGSFTDLQTFNHIVSGGILWLWTRIRAEGDQIKGKIWAAGDPEPAEWGAEATDSTHQDAGWAGLGKRAGGTVIWTSACAAFNGDAVLTAT